MRTCDCGWIADWDLGDKLSCTLYMLGSAIRMWAGSGEPPRRGPGGSRTRARPQAPGAFALLRRTIQLFPKPDPGEPPARYLY